MLGTPVAMAVVMFGLAGVAVVWARSCVVPSPLLAAGILAGLTAFDLAINNGPNSSTALPVEVYDVLDPATHNATIAILKSKVVVTSGFHVSLSLLFIVALPDFVSMVTIFPSLSMPYSMPARTAAITR